MSAVTLEQAQQSVVPLEYSVVVNKVTNINLPARESAMKGLNEKVKVCWVRKARVIET